ncbi:Carboxymuconolactone decarboxylase family protein [compost metagenome]
MIRQNTTLDKRQQYIVKISAYASKSDAVNLQKNFTEALDAGLNINEIKEALVHVHAYAGFPPSIFSLNTFKQVVEQRASSGKKDQLGRENSAVDEKISLYERGEKAQMQVTGLSAETLKEIMSFAPIMDVFLKEHLFGDLFDRDVLDYIDRELVTVAVLAALHHPFVRSHIGGALNVDVTRGQLEELFDIIEKEIGKAEADTSRNILTEVLESRK